jgi:hypothetical protein
VSWTADDGDALFRQPPEVPGGDDHPSAFDDSREAMLRLRFPFEADPADVLEQQRSVPVDEDEYRG